MSLVRVPHPKDRDKVPSCSTLEIYLSFLLCNNNVRFETGLPEEENGHWLSVQVSTFTRALMAVQVLIDTPPLVGSSRKRAQKIEWTKQYGLPAFPALLTKLILPRGGGVYELVRRLGDDISERREAVHPAERWRRLHPGEPRSQIANTGGALPTCPLLWSPPLRMTKTTPPRWALERYEVRAFLRALKQCPQAKQQVGALTMWERWKQIGIVSQPALRSYAYAQMREGQRYGRIIEHARRVREGHKMHLISIATAGQRPQCLACSRYGPLESVLLWMKQECRYADACHASNALEQLHAAKSRAEAVHCCLHGSTSLNA